VAQLRQEKDRFKQLGARVVLVGLGTPEETAAFKTQFKVPFAMIADPEKKLFKAFHLKQASLGGLLSVGMAVKGLSAVARGHGIGIPKGDVRQLPGVFIIDTGGRIRFSHFARDPADHPKPEVLLAFLRKGT
jgi:peroxiredoxin